MISTLIGIYYAPAKVFAAQREKPCWWLPMLATLVLTFLFTFVFLRVVGMETIVRNQLESGAAARNLSPEQIDSIVQESARSQLQQVLALVAGPLGAVVVIVIVAAVLLAMAQMTGGNLRFPQTLAVTGYAYWAYSLIASVLACIVLLTLPDFQGVDFQNLVALNPSVFLDRETTAKAVYKLASSFDLLVFYCIFLMGLGLSVISGRMTVKKGIVLVAIPWLVFVLIRAAVASIF